MPPELTDSHAKPASSKLWIDYVPPSVAGLTYLQGWVFWPLTTDLEANPVSGSVHRMVVFDVTTDYHRHAKRWHYASHWFHCRTDQHWKHWHG